jgi:hypothetical protein
MARTIRQPFSSVRFALFGFLSIPNVPNWIVAALSVATPFLYGVYALLILEEIVKGRAWQYAGWVLGVHWLGVAIAAVLVYRDENGFFYTLHVIGTAAPLIFLELAFFALAHWLLWRVVREARSAGRD